MKNTHKRTSFYLSCFFLSYLFVIASVAAQETTSDIATVRARAMILVEQNRYLDAYPLLDKAARSLTGDVELWAHYGIAIAARSAVIKDPNERKAERKRAYEALKKANELGTKNVMALHFLDQLPPDGGEDDNFTSSNPEVEKALREGEEYFGKGEYQKAFLSYEKAHKLDPKNYEAALFLGDTFYAQQKYTESEPWFAKAAEIDPDRELAHRFWGDALMYQGKIKEASEKFIDAFVSDPYSRYAWENINKLTQKYNRQFSVKLILPPGSEAFKGITIDISKLDKRDGTDLWRKYGETRELWKRETFKKVNPAVPYRHTLKEEAAALRAVAEAGAALQKSGGLKVPHHSLVTVMELDRKNLIESYVLIMLPDEGIAEDYFDYRQLNRGKLRQFLSEYVFVF